MPKSKVAKKKPKSVKMAKSRSYGNPTRNLSGYVKMGLGFPKKIQMTHRYVQPITLTTPTGAIVVNNFRANGMFDPDQSGVGHQPLYFDQMTPLYNHYVVIGSKITVKFFASNTTNPVPFYATIFLNDDTSLSVSNISYVLEQSQSKKVAIIQANSVKPYVLSCNFSAKKIFGGNVMSNPRLEGTTATDPIEQTYFQVLAQPVDGVSNISVTAHVTISYIAVWKELKDVNFS